MRTINAATLAAQVTPTIVRANKVRQDPAVVKAAKVAAADIHQAGLSTTSFISEVSSSWRRHGDGLVVVLAG